MVPSPPTPESGNFFASAKSADSMRRRKQDDAKNNTNINDELNLSENTKISTAGRRSALFSAGIRQRKWFRGDRKKVVADVLIAVGFLCFWSSIRRFEYGASNNSGDGGITRKSNSKSNLTKPATENAPWKNNDGGGRSQSYDSIFCRAGDFSKDDEESHGSYNETKPVFLWGIPSTSSDFETGRRKLLRDTYLGFYQQLRSDEKNLQSPAAIATAQNKDPGAICSLHDWTCDARVRSGCQMIYVFFVGGHPAAPKMEARHGPLPPPILLNESTTDFREMLLPRDDGDAEGIDFKEPGTVYLDIRENQFDGKMTTWFKFASLVANEYNSHARAPTGYYPKIEYVFKVDSDLMLLTPHFFNWFEGVHDDQRKLQESKGREKLSSSESIHGNNDLLPSPPPGLIRRVYGGIEFPPTNCVINFTFDHPCPLPLSGPSYMSGELNFASVDLATYMASDGCPRDRWTIPHEDVSLSNYVYSYINNTEYHKRENHQALVSTKAKSTSNSTIDDDDHAIHVVGVNESMVLLLPSMRANWEHVFIKKDPDVLRTGELLWGHSIKRGNYTQYLYWKKDAKFLSFWKLFYKIYTTTGNAAITPVRRIKGGGGGNIKNSSSLQHLRSALRHQDPK